MRTITRALAWSAGLEAILLAPVLLGNYVHLSPFDAILGILAYLALFCHAPAVYTLSHWPSAQETMVLPAFIQWLIWFIMFTAAFKLADWFRLRHSADDTGVR